MASTVRQTASPLSASGSPSGTMLAQFREAHEQLMREMDNMDRITLGPLPDAPQFTAARWQTSQASLRRRTLSARVVDHLACRVDAQEASRLKGLRAEYQLSISGSARHIYEWTTQSIRRDWDGYCKASREIRMLMKANMLLERQILCPMLERIADRGI